MNKNLAANLVEGDIIQNLFGDQVVVESKHISFKDGKILEVIITVIDTQLNKWEYIAEDVYTLDMNEESDEEKAWVDWTTKNKGQFYICDDYTLTKEAFMGGYTRGFNYKKKISVEEQLQK